MGKLEGGEGYHDGRHERKFVSAKSRKRMELLVREFLAGLLQKRVVLQLEGCGHKDVHDMYSTENSRAQLFKEFESWCWCAPHLDAVTTVPSQKTFYRDFAVYFNVKWDVSAHRPGRDLCDLCVEVRREIGKWTRTVKRLKQDGVCDELLVYAEGCLGELVALMESHNRHFIDHRRLWDALRACSNAVFCVVEYSRTTRLTCMLDARTSRGYYKC